MVSRENTVQCPLALEPSLGSSRLSQLSTAGDVASFGATSLQLGSTVAEVADFGCGHEVATLLEFLRDRVARMRSSEAGQDGCTEDVGELHGESFKKIVVEKNECLVVSVAR